VPSAMSPSGSLNTSSTSALKLNGIECTADNIKNKTYAISRPFLLLTQGMPSAEVQPVLDYILSADGQALVTEEKFISVQ